MAESDFDKHFGRIHARHSGALIRYMIECRKACDGDLDLFLIMAIVGERKGIDLRGTRVKVTKEMAADPVRRISRLTVHFQMSGTFSDEQKQLLINTANACPVHKALHGTVEMPVTFTWE